MLDQTFIRVYGNNRVYDKDIKDSTEIERREWYSTLSRNELINLVEKLGGFKK